jgi:hypothetical protein
VLEVDILTYNMALKSGHCMIGLDGCTIYDALDVTRCYRCNGYNHSIKNCKNQVSCPRCAGKHEIKECKATDDMLKCVNCLTHNTMNREETDSEEVAHAAWDHDRCPCYKRNVQKLKDDIFGDLIK